jgi:hypothetical protein
MISPILKSRPKRKPRRGDGVALRCLSALAAHPCPRGCHGAKGAGGYPGFPDQTGATVAGQRRTEPVFPLWAPRFRATGAPAPLLFTWPVESNTGPGCCQTRWKAGRRFTCDQPFLLGSAIQLRSPAPRSCRSLRAMRCGVAGWRRGALRGARVEAAAALRTRAKGEVWSVRPRRARGPAARIGGVFVSQRPACPARFDQTGSATSLCCGPALVGA